MRFEPRSTWPIAPAAAISAATRPNAKAFAPEPSSEPCSKACVRRSPAGPGATPSIVPVRTSLKVSWPSIPAKPTIAIRPGRRVRMNWKASAREWLKPSA